MKTPGKHWIFKWSGCWYGWCDRCSSCSAATVTDGGQPRVMLMMENHVTKEHPLTVTRSPATF